MEEKPPNTPLDSRLGGNDGISVVPDVQPNGARSFGFALVVVAVAAVAFALMIRQGMQPAPSVRGHKAPVLLVAGWLNGPGPSQEQLHGKVIVIDAWAYWCERCRAKAPQLVKLHDTYRDKGVVFLGLTEETAETIADSQKFLDETKFTWPSGYDAGNTIAALRAEQLPAMWIIDRNYNLVWDDKSSEPIEHAIERALGTESR